MDQLVLQASKAQQVLEALMEDMGQLVQLELKGLQDSKVILVYKV
jgi:hypothetical protein